MTPSVADLAEFVLVDVLLALAAGYPAITERLPEISVVHYRSPSVSAARDSSVRDSAKRTGPPIKRRQSRQNNLHQPTAMIWSP